MEAADFFAGEAFKRAKTNGFPGRRQRVLTKDSRNTGMKTHFLFEASE